MYAFKVAVTTILMIWLFVCLYIGLGVTGKGKMAALIMLIVDALSIIAIWG